MVAAETSDVALDAVLLMRAADPGNHSTGGVKSSRPAGAQNPRETVRTTHRLGGR